MNKTIQALALGGAAALSLACTQALAARCGHDAHGAPRIEVTKLTDTDSVITYFSPATLIMDNPKDPVHRAFGECRGQAMINKSGQFWQGACFWKAADGDVFVSNWSSKPGDTGPEKRETLHGTGIFYGTGKFAAAGVTKFRWSGLANGGSYFCEE